MLLSFEDWWVDFWLIIIFSAGPLIIFFWITSNILSYLGIWKYKKKKISFQEIENIKSFLKKHLYYQKLSSEGGEKFIDRLVRFMINKKFLGMENLQVTDEMRARISACAVQLTFGLDDYMLPLFKLIEIFPKEFYSRGMKKYLRGGTSPTGVIMISWSNFLDGFADPTDKYNLGLHEMAHALLLDMLYGDEPNKQMENKIGQWENVGDIEMEKLRDRQPHFLREYAKTNKEEFFDVCVEHFFEVPEEFKKNLPEVYKRLCILLNQDPLNISGDYKLI